MYARRTISALIPAALLVTAVFSGGRVNAQSRTATPTFTKDVAPVFYKNCVSCHRPTMFAPMSLITYDDVRPWARAIKQRVVAREMPPWSADPKHGDFEILLTQINIGGSSSPLRQGTLVSIRCQIPVTKRITGATRPWPSKRKGTGTRAAR